MGRRQATAATRLLVLVSIATGALAVNSVPAGACSCAGTDARTALERADGAFVGAYTGREDPDGGGQVISSGRTVVNHFDVERAVKGDFGDRVDVDSAAEGGSCGLEVSVGDRIGLFLQRDGDRWVAGLCSQVDPERLLAAAEPLPEPTSSGPVALVVAGRYGPNRLIALDAAGEIVAYGTGQDETISLALCPGGSVVLELFHSRERDEISYLVPHLGIRRLADLELLAEYRFDDLSRTNDNQRDLRSLSCRSAAGDDALAFVTEGVDEERDGRIIRISGSKVATVWEGSASTAGWSRDGGRAYVTVPLGSGRERLVVVDLVSGAEQPVAEFSTWTGPFVESPNGDRVAAVSYSPPMGVDPPPSAVVLVDLKTEPPNVDIAPLARSNVSGEVVWWNDDRLVFLPGGGDADYLRVFDAALRQVAAWQDTAGGFEADILGNRLVRAGFGGVTCVDPEAGSTGVVRSFGDSRLYAVVAIPGSALSVGCAEDVLEDAPATISEGAPVSSSIRPDTSRPDGALDIDPEPTGSSSDLTWPGAMAAAALALVAGGLAWRRRASRRSALLAHR